MVIKKTFACLAACIENIRHFVSLVARGKGPSRMRGLREPVCSRRAARCGTKKLSAPESAGLLCRDNSAVYLMDILNTYLFPVLHLNLISSHVNVFMSSI